MAQNQLKKNAPGSNAVGKDGKRPDRAGLHDSPWIALMAYHIHKYGVSQSDLAEAAGMTRAMFSHCMTGRNNPPIDGRLDKIIHRLGLNDEEAKQLRLDALLANSPREISDLIKELRKENEALRLKHLRSQ